MKVFLSGYGKMGRMLEELALEGGWDIVGHADITCDPSATPFALPRGL